MNLFQLARSTSSTKSATFFKTFSSLSRQRIGFIESPSSLSSKGIFVPIRRKQTIDRSRFPILEEKDLEESFIRGHGPGGSNVNKNSNCAQIKHIPTGIVVKSHQSRNLDKNREIARQVLRERLDELYNGDMSIKAQIERIQEKKSSKSENKREKLADLKNQYKQIIQNQNQKITTKENGDVNIGDEVEQK